jgi:hypothetical protein
MSWLVEGGSAGRDVDVGGGCVFCMDMNTYKRTEDYEQRRRRHQVATYESTRAHFESITTSANTLTLQSGPPSAAQIVSVLLGFVVPMSDA